MTWRENKTRKTEGKVRGAETQRRLVMQRFAEDINHMEVRNGHLNVYILVTLKGGKAFMGV